MTKDRIRRLELGKMFLDVAKYIFTIVVIGGLISVRISNDTVLLGIVLGCSMGAVGFLIIPPGEKDDHF